MSKPSSHNSGAGLYDTVTMGPVGDYHSCREQDKYLAYRVYKYHAYI